MNGINGENQANQGSANESQKPIAFCQHCGKPLDHETRRVVGTAVFCEPCLTDRLSHATVYPGPNAAGGYGPVTNVAGIPMPASQPNPGLAALLGLIPGVGAMYNEQYAKGIVHLVIFALLVSFSHVTAIFIMFVFGWLAYMSIEAHHTAKARRDGTPLPNPFGFNDIGERFGFGKAWPGAPDVATVARDAANAAATEFGRMHTGFNPGTAGPSTPGPSVYATPAPGTPATDPAGTAGPSWGAPGETYPPAAGTPPNYGSASYGAPTYGQPYTQAYNQGHPYQYGTQSPYGASFVPPVAAPGATPVMPPMVPLQSRFPTGALWLIGLGTFFLLGTTGIFRGISAGLFVGFLLIGLGVWIFLRRMMDTGMGLENDGSVDYRFRVVRALRASVWLVLVGLLLLLNEARWLRWEYSWPWFIILAGVMMLLNRAAYNTAATAMYTPSPVPPAPAPVNPGTAIVPVEPTESGLYQEGN